MFTNHTWLKLTLAYVKSITIISVKKLHFKLTRITYTIHTGCVGNKFLIVKEPLSFTRPPVMLDTKGLERRVPCSVVGIFTDVQTSKSLLSKYLTAFTSFSGALVTLRNSYTFQTTYVPTLSSSESLSLKCLSTLIIV